MMLDPKSLLVRSDDVPSTILEGSLVLLDIASGDYVSLTGTASDIWDALAQPISVEGIVSKLRTEYDIDLETCSSEVLEFVGELLACGMAREVSAEKAR